MRPIEYAKRIIDGFIESNKQFLQGLDAAVKQAQESHIQKIEEWKLKIKGSED